MTLFGIFRNQCLKVLVMGVFKRIVNPSISFLACIPILSTSITFLSESFLTSCGDILGVCAGQAMPES